MDTNGKEILETWDLYDKNRVFTGKTHRRRDPMKDGEYHLVVHVCILNSKNQLLIQQRQPFKTGWPNMWDLTVGGSALSGETSQKAAERETLEEIGVKIDLSKTRPQFTIHFEYGFDDYYILEQEIDISECRLQQEEVQKVKWAGKKEVLKMQEEGTMIPYYFMDKLFEIKGQYGSIIKEDQRLAIQYAKLKNLDSWMSLVHIVKGNFPGLETKEKVEEYKNTVIESMNQNSAVCALYGNMVVGILLFSKNHNLLGCMAVHPEFRRMKIATDMVKVMLENFDDSKDIVVETFREGDKKGVESRSFYKSMGFKEGELDFANSYPVQRFVLKRRDKNH